MSLLENWLVTTGQVLLAKLKEVRTFVRRRDRREALYWVAASASLFKTADQLHAARIITKSCHAKITSQFNAVMMAWGKIRERHLSAYGTMPLSLVEAKAFETFLADQGLVS